MILNSDVESFGENFISQIRIADSEDTLKNISDENLVIIGKEVCESSETWVNEQGSLTSIKKVLNENGIVVTINDRLLPIMRFQSTYELCLEYVNRLESLFIEE